MKTSELLLKQATEIREGSAEVVAIGLLKQAGLSDSDARALIAQREMEKVAQETLVLSGVDSELATEMVKAASVDISSLSGFIPELTAEEKQAEFLEKVAAEVAALEDQVQALQSQVAELEKSASEYEETPEYIQKLASSGAFTSEDLAALKKLPEDTLTKIASSQEAPWSMGHGAGQNASLLDPIAQFCMS